MSIDLKQLVDDLRERDVQVPILIRFTDILQHRVGEIHKAFDNAIREMSYGGAYKCVYPIKVNQQRHVVEEIHDIGKRYGFGLEAGSKPELMAVMGIVDDDKTPIICNGFKDDEFIEAVILATKIGRTIIPVVEKFSELEAIVKFAKIHGVRPKIGVRVKLSAKAPVVGNNPAARDRNSVSSPARSWPRSSSCASTTWATAWRCCTTTSAVRSTTSAR